MMLRLIESEGRWIRALIILATLTVALVFAGLAANVVLYFSDIILILVMAWLFAFVLSPIVGSIKRFLPVAPRSLVVVIVYAVLFLILSAIVLVIASELAASIVNFTDELPTLQERLPEILAPWNATALGAGPAGRPGTRLQPGARGDRPLLGPVPGTVAGAGAGQPEHARQPHVHDLPVALHRHRQGRAAGLHQPDHAATVRRGGTPLPDQRGFARSGASSVVRPSRASSMAPSRWPGAWHWASSSCP